MQKNLVKETKMKEVKHTKKTIIIPILILIIGITR
jgi:hypothetical protein